jgi:hypothetical protein
MYFWMLPSSGQDDIRYTYAVTALKKCVLGEMVKRRSVETVVGKNRDWFRLRLAAVLFDPFLKLFAFGGDEASAAEADSCASAVTIWMAVRAERERSGISGDPSTSDDPATPAERATKQPRLSFASNVREFAWSNESGGVSIATAVAPPVTCGIIDAAAVGAEWGAYKKHHIRAVTKNHFHGGKPMKLCSPM